MVKKMDKVFCSECVYYRQSYGTVRFNTEYKCKHRSNKVKIVFDDTPIHRGWTSYEEGKCEFINKNNDCRLFKPNSK